MQTAEIASKARFDYLRYAQLWEDADVLTAALGSVPGKTFVSICSAGDNALSLLTLDPAKVVTVDLSMAQIAALKLRMSAYRTLPHKHFLELMGSRASSNRSQLLGQVLKGCDDDTCAFWGPLEPLVINYGVGGAGKFERYFRIFRTRLLPLVHSTNTIDEMFKNRSEAEREHFLNTRFNTWRWRLLLKVFFSNTVMGRLGRDKSFFDHVDGSLSDHVASRVHHAAVLCNPAENPYLHWIMKGTHGDALPMSWRAEHYSTICDRLDRIDIVHGALESLIDSGVKADGFNLSDIFEYMSPEVFENVYEQVLTASNPGARLVYWNMMVPRRAPERHQHKVVTKHQLEEALKPQDKAFFYSDFVIEDVL